MIGYHASHIKIDKLDYSKLVKSITTNHDNGALGLWCSSTINDWVSAIGPYLHVIEIEGPCFDMPIRTLSDMSHLDKQGHADYRNSKLQEGYTHFRLIEINGDCAMFVVLDLDKAVIKEIKTIVDYAK